MDRREIVKTKINRRRGFICLHAVRHSLRNGFQRVKLTMTEYPLIKGKGE